MLSWTLSYSGDRPSGGHSQETASRWRSHRPVKPPVRAASAISTVDTRPRPTVLPGEIGGTETTVVEVAPTPLWWQGTPRPRYMLSAGVRIVAWSHVMNAERQEMCDQDSVIAPIHDRRVFVA